MCLVIVLVMTSLFKLFPGDRPRHGSLDIGLISLSSLSLTAATLNLFDRPIDPDSSSKGEEPCGKAIVQQFQKKFHSNSSKVFDIDEANLHLCPNFCSNSTLIDDFCTKFNRDFSAKLGAHVHSDRCCDKKRCQCACHFRCKTFEDKKEEYKQEGFTHCLYGRNKESTMKAADDICKSLGHALTCSLTHQTKFLCPRQFVCVLPRGCLVCVKPTCVTDEDKSIAEMVLKAKNETENSKNDQDNREKKRKYGGAMRGGVLVEEAVVIS